MRDLQWLRWWLAGGFALLSITVYWSLSPSPVGLPENDCDKCGHVIVYFALMAWFTGQVLPRHRWRLAVAIVLFGISLEFLQQALGPRLYELLDILANAAGVGLAWLAARLGIAGWAEWVEGLVLRPRRR